MGGTGSRWRAWEQTRSQPMTGRSLVALTAIATVQTGVGHAPRLHHEADAHGGPRTEQLPPVPLM